MVPSAFSGFASAGQALTLYVLAGALPRGVYGVQAAANRKLEYMLGVFADPIYFGDYPASVKERISVLQPISPELVRMLGPNRAMQAL